MITSISLENYKSIVDSCAFFKNLTLITGANGSGKSTLYEPLLLLKQSIDHFDFDIKNKPNDFFLGTKNSKCIILLENYNNLTNYYARDADKVKFKIENRNSNKTIDFELEPNKNTENYYVPCSINQKEWDINLLSGNFNYIPASRILIGNINYYPNRDNLGYAKNMIASYVNDIKDSPVSIEALYHPLAKSNLLLENLSLWISEIMDKNIKIFPKIIEHNGNKYFELFYKENHKEVSCQNLGDGFKSVLPLVLILLNSKVDDLVIIDKPELNLYGSNISILIKLITLTAQAGVQVICETNSDHIINGALVACKDNQYIDRNNITILYMEKNPSISDGSKVTEVFVTEGSRIIYPPTNFFNQIKSDQKILMGF